ncbi:putative transmembrane protein [Mycolicibacterium aurum]|uniref:Putative transmembrane protein n=1 Tax=Mycolicibacterium aurum TaxID=1791 RepID=A0A448IYL5_MYCAU|nr:gephyrin-like molybdotransferase receptor GlpR [Mycolicibacterium aurum]VEG57534.1 putative transmembrane protein [Mycolicibacterium aurum]
MPSIPQSLLWISLVVLWLFVLVPMLISKRDAVRRTSDVALATRVLNSSASARLRRRRGPASGHRSDPDWQPSGDVDDIEDDEPSRSVVMVATDARADEGEPDYLDVDIVEDSGALPVSEVPADDVRAAEPVVAETDELTLDYSEGDESDESDDTRQDRRVTAATEDTSRWVAAEDEYEYDDDSSDLEEPSETDLRIADSMSDSRRRRRESTTAEAVSARKYRFRARTIAVLSVLMLASAVAAYTWSSTMWWVAGAIGAVTLLYLAYLRRQTRIEEQLRRRRAQRMARSRLGVENTSDREFDVTPARLRRPGAAVLEIDDEDPAFEHLDYVPFSRHYDLPRAAGQ